MYTADGPTRARPTPDDEWLASTRMLGTVLLLALLIGAAIIAVAVAL